MTIYDALKVLSLDQDSITKEDMLKAYKALAKKYHPDINPHGLNMMKLLNEAKDSLLEARYPIEIKQTQTQNYSEEVFNALESIAHLSLNVEICGSWIWVSGDTKSFKDILKENKFKFSGNKKMWYFRPESEKRIWKGKPKFSIDEIRFKYGSERVNQKPRPQVSYYS